MNRDAPIQAAVEVYNYVHEVFRMSEKSSSSLALHYLQDIVFETGLTDHEDVSKDIASIVEKHNIPTWNSMSAYEQVLRELQYKANAIHLKYEEAL